MPERPFDDVRQPFYVSMRVHRPDGAGHEPVSVEHARLVFAATVNHCGRSSPRVLPGRDAARLAPFLRWTPDSILYVRSMYALSCEIGTSLSSGATMLSSTSAALCQPPG